MIEIINHLPDTDAEQRALGVITEAYEEVQELLSGLPANLQIYFDNGYLIPETGDGGFAYAPNILTISYDSNFENKDLQAQHLRSTIFHESYHLAQGHTREQSSAVYRHALDSAIYEGAASVFERTYTQPSLLPGDYSMHTVAQLQDWARTLSAITIDDYNNENTGLWMKWAIYDKSTGERWRIYKVGTYLVDRALLHPNVDIIDLHTKSAEEILRLSGLAS